MNGYLEDYLKNFAKTMTYKPSGRPFLLVLFLGSMLFCVSYYQMNSGLCLEQSKYCFSGDKQNEVRNVQDLRRIKEVCRKYEGTPVSENGTSLSLYHTYVDDKNEMLYYFIPKTGCTVWKAIYSIVTGASNETDPSKINRYDVHFVEKYISLQEFNQTEKQKRLDSYYSFVVVRHPFERLVSGYLDKFIDPGEDYFKQTHGSVWVKKYRPNATEDEIRQGVPTFTEFVSHLIEPETISSYEIDSHWNQYYKLCHPCHVNYDYVVRFENFKEDTEHVLKVRQLDKIVNYTYSKPKTTNGKLKKFLGLLTLDQISQLYQAYKYDFELFGYEFDIRDYMDL